jgi:multidrug efflux pump subunit AcrB
MSDVFTALQATLGGIYINNFNLFGRTWQVNVRRQASNRGTFRHLANLCAKCDWRDGADPFIAS